MEKKNFWGEEIHSWMIVEKSLVNTDHTGAKYIRVHN